jgi:hypothetical protein
MKQLRRLPGRILLAGSNLQEALDKARQAESLEAIRVHLEDCERHLERMLHAAGEARDAMEEHEGSGQQSCGW